MENRVEKRTAELNEARERLQYLLAVNPAIIYTNQASGDFATTFVSENSHSIVGYTPREMLDDPKFWVRRLHPEDAPRVLSDVHRLIAQGGGTVEYRFRHRGGHYFWIQDTFKVLCDATGRVSEIVGSWADITERKRVEGALGDHIKQVETLRAVTGEITRELDLSILLELITQRAVDLIEAATSGVIYLWDEADDVLIPRAWHGRGEWLTEVRLRIGEGLTGTVAQRREGLLVNDYQGSPYAKGLVVERPGFTAVVAEPLLYRDRLVGVITLTNEETKRPFTQQDAELLALFAAETAIAIENARLFEEVRETRQYLERLIESSTTAIISADKGGNIVLFNEGAEAMLGFQREEIIGRRVTELYESEDRAKELMRQMRRQGGKVSAFETVLRAKDGTPIPVLISASILYDAEGQEAGTVGFNKDLRERKEAEEALLAANVEIQETRQYLERLIESATDAIISTDKDGNVVLFNEGAEAILGFQREEIIGQHVTLVYESKDRAKELMRLMRKQGGTVSAFETTLRAKDGTPIPVMISASILYDEQGQEAGTVGFNKDLRPLKQAEEELRRAKAQIQALRIEIDQTKRARRVSEIIETDYFQDLEKKVEELRDRSTPEPA